MLELHTSASLGGNGTIAPRAPMPDGAIGYSDFIAGLHVTDTQVSVLSSTAIALRPTNLSTGYVYGKDDVISAGNNWGKLDYDHAGDCLGLRVNAAYTQLVAASQRQDMTAGIATGGIASLEPAPEPWQRWALLTPAVDATEASLALSTAAIAAGSSVFYAVDVQGTGIVQIGSKAESAVWANFDLLSGVSETAPGVKAAMIKRRKGWTLGTIWTPAAALADGQPYVASVASISSGRLSDSGKPFRARLARVVRPGGAGYGFPPPAPATDSASVGATAISQQSTLIADTAPFSTIFRLKAGWTPTQTDSGLFRFVISGTNGLELRFSSSNALVLWDRQSGGALVHAFAGVSYVPGGIYRVGVSRAADGTICIAVNGEMVTVSVPSVATAAPRWAGGLLPNQSWSGHIQVVILWVDAKSAEDLAALCERHL